MPHECFADEIAIDFPSVGRCVERMRNRFLGVDGDAADADVLCADVLVSRYEASKGLVLPLDVPVRSTCSECGGRGETWTERCVGCNGTGQSQVTQSVKLTLPRGIADGARVRFRVKASDGSFVRVLVRIAIRSAV
jgi:hypothetical protein